MKRRISHYLLALALAVGGFAQSPTDWIVENQSYITLKIAEDGWYRVSSVELQQAGFPTGSISAAQLQLFRRGEEIAIHTETQTGSAALDYLEFWGEKNTGVYDAELYNGDVHPHTYYNLFTDTATYYLTWSSSSNHRRIQVNTQNDNTGLAPTVSHQKTDRILQVSEYASGRFFGGSGGDFQLSNYDGGEGWTGGRVSKGSSQDFSFSLSDRSSAEAVQVEIIAIGRNSLQHVVTVSAGATEGSLVDVGSFSFSGYTAYRHLQSVDDSQIGDSGELIIRCTVTGVEGATDFVSFSSVQVTYDQALNLQEGTSEVFTFPVAEVDRRFLQIDASQPASFTFYDITDPVSVVQLPQNALTGSAEFVVPSANTERIVAAIAEPKSIPSIAPANFDLIHLVDRDYLIITHELLRENANGSDPVQNYADYRSSAAGGGYRVEVAEIDDIYAQYNYGDPSVLGIRRLFEEAYNEGVDQVLILSKGRTVNQDLYRRVYGAVDTLSTSEVFVPTYGVPGGDNMYSIGINPDEPLVPAMATGRLSVWKPDQVQAYLDKVKAMEAVGYDQLWRKNLLHLSGGTTVSELNTFADFIEEFKEVAEGDFLGGRALNQNKQTSAVSESFDLSTEVNKGVGFITLFGHSSNTVTDVEIGTPSNQAFNYQNEGRYPLIIVNGCKAGEIFGNTFSFGEDWVSYPSAGAIGFIAHADQAGSNNLKRYTDRLYDIAFADTSFFGASIGEVMVEASRQYYQGAAGTSESSQTQIQQTLFQGDPALAYFGPKFPDFSLIEERITAESIEGELLLASQDSFLLKIPVANYGVTSLDSLDILIERTYPNGDQQVYTFLLPPVKYSDTLEVYLNHDQDAVVGGLNELTISIDPDNSIIELNELNNVARFEVFISEGSTQHLFPYNLGLIRQDTVTLIWQPSDPFESSRAYVIEIDTLDNFGSPFYIQELVTGADILSYDLPLNGLEDVTTIYWRTRFSEMESPSDSIYATSSFTYSQSFGEGWGQFTFSQLSQSEFEGMVLDRSTLQPRFTISEVPIQITTPGTEFFDYANARVLVNQNNLLVTDNTLDPFCRVNTLNALVFDRNNAQLKRPIALSQLDVFEVLVCGQLPQMIYNFTSSDLLTDRRLEELIENMAPGDQIVLFNMDSVSFSSFDAAIQQVLEDVGISASTWPNLIDGQPFVAIGKKGANVGEALLFTSDGSSLAPQQQTVVANGTVVATANQGTISSPIIGPATSWISFRTSLDLQAGDIATIKFTAIAENGESITYDEADFESFIDLSFIVAQQFPFLTFEIELLDPEELTPPSIDYFNVSFAESPEGVIVPQQKQGSEIQEGQLFEAEFDFINVSEVDFQDSLQVNISLRNIESEQVEEVITTLPPLAAYDTAKISYERSTVGISGQNDLTVNVVTQQAERLKVNNRLSKSKALTVTPETIRPLVDVTIDGRYILDGEIVSSEPLIHVSFTDENRFLKKTDTIGISLALQRPGSTTFENIAFTDPGLVWSAATEDKPFEIDYQPTLMEDGVYVLGVEAADESGNPFADEPYQVSFEVINQSTITHFYPYPNPFSTQCRFVFTLTGSVLPDDIMIQIMTLSGRVVKTIDESEIGPIHIGNNITEYAWDGRDEYGDLLANGVYLYRVVVQSSGEDLDRRNTSADQGFKNGIGKIYILR
jgi:hypothetical protein